MFRRLRTRPLLLAFLAVLLGGILVRLIIGGKPYTTLDGTSVQITRAASDPVPTCALSLQDVSSALNPQPFQEVLLLDDQQTPNPTVNLLLNPTLNPYTTSWVVATPGTGETFSQNPGGGLILTYSNNTEPLNTPFHVVQQLPLITAGQTYCASMTVVSSSLVGMQFGFQMTWIDGANNVISNSTSAPITPTSTPTRYSYSATAPATALFCIMRFYEEVTNATNSGSMTWTNVQMEPVWIPAISYPTPFCGPSQTNCQQLPLGQWIRQYRKFAGFVTNVTAHDYHGNVRTLDVNASGYAWLMGTILANDSFSSQTDSAIISSLLNKYLIAPAPYFGLYGSTYLPMLTTTNVVTGQTVSNLQSNWDDLRTLFDGLAGLSAFYWTVDAYWNFIYAPPGYITMPISLICDNSSNPDLKTTFPAYTFSAEQDGTQPGSTILVLGSGSNVSEVIDPNQPGSIGAISGYALPTGTSWMRKVNDSTLASTTDCTNRGLAELTVYDYPRNLYHLSTQVELIPGEAIAITSATEGLNKSTQLIQQVQATWLGTDETLKDVWEYQADLGAVNRRAVNILSRIFRQTQRGSSAPAISVTTLAALEKPLNIVESVGTGTAPGNYLQAVQPDGPTALYPFNEIAGGTIADDYSGNANQGSATGGITEGATGLLTDAADTGNTAFLFNGTNAVVTCPTGVNGNGLTAYSVECWCSLSTGSLGSQSTIMAASTGTNTVGYQLCWSSTTSIQWIVGNGSSSAIASFTVTATAGVTFHLVGTYDGANIRLYVNGALKATTPLTGGISSGSNVPAIGALSNSTHFYPGTVQYPAIYSGTTLNSTQVSNHYTAGT